MKLILTADSGPLANQQFEVTATGIKIGRHPAQNQVVLDDTEVSRHHARIFLAPDGQVWIEDSSANGTYVNGRKIEKVILHPGDKIRLGVNPANEFTISESQAGDGGGLAMAVGAGSESSPQLVSAARPRSTIRVNPEEGAVPQGARLQLVVDRYAVQTIPLTSARTVLGRHAGTDKIAIDSPGVSETHAELVFAGPGQALLRDLRSEQGTWVNGERVNERALKEGDLIRLGNSESRFLLYRQANRRALVLRDIELDRAVTRMGRDTANEVRLDHPTVSLFHAAIAKDNGTFTIEDKGSTNGTYVNGTRIGGRQKLKPKDRITLGAIQLSFDGSLIEQQSDGRGVRLNAYSLCRTVQNGGQRKSLLQNVSLSIEPREFVGLLGPSGSGKSTLMYSLSGFRRANEGRVEINREELYTDRGALRAMMGYVPQDDILHTELTVSECLYFAARLRLPDDFSERDIWDRVNRVVRDVHLSDHAKKPIYVLSGGQRKRVNLGMELLCQPSLLFLDEPTAGQDPKTEMELMYLFREIANNGSTIVLTTHLLGSFSLLDKVAVLVGGRLCYFGPSQEMLSYFHASNPTAVYDVLEDKSKTPEHWSKQFENSDTYREFVADPLGLDKSAPSRRAEPKTQIAAPKRSEARSFSTLLTRLLTLKFKDFANVAVLVLPPPLIALLLGVMMAGSPNNPKAIFILVIVALWFGCSAAVREIVDERQIYERERQRNLSIPAYLGSKLVYLGGLAGVQSLLLAGVSRLAGLEQEHFLVAWAVLWLMTLHGALLGLLVSAWAPNAERALFAFPLVLIPQLLFAGLLIPVKKLELFLPSENQPPSVFTNPQEPIDGVTKTQFGMSAAIHYGIAPLIAARWGIEALGDTYIHDNRFADPQALTTPRNPVESKDSNPPKAPTKAKGEKQYSFDLSNALTYTFHNHDAKTELNAYKASLVAKKQPAETPSALPSYLQILGGMAAAMIGWIALVLKLKD